MVPGSVTKGTIPDEMHGCNGQKAFPHGQGEESTGGAGACLLLGELSWKICPGKVVPNKGKPALTPFKIPFLLPNAVATFHIPFLFFLVVLFYCIFSFIASFVGKHQQMGIPFRVWQLLAPKINSVYPTGKLL